ncbi:hypothetical protein ANTPLA_LOCUS9960 [Anthophora plagiata]
MITRRSDHARVISRPENITAPILHETLRLEVPARQVDTGPDLNFSGPSHSPPFTMAKDSRQLMVKSLRPE